MNRSKIDRINDFYAQLVREAIESCRLDAHTALAHSEAVILEKWSQRIEVRSRAGGTYERLELEDIIKGHKRAWPET